MALTCSLAGLLCTDVRYSAMRAGPAVLFWAGSCNTATGPLSIFRHIDCKVEGEPRVDMDHNSIACKGDRPSDSLPMRHAMYQGHVSAMRRSNLL